MTGRRRRRAAGFTLIEMIVVVIIITMLAGASVAMMGVFLRGQGIRSGATMVATAISQAKQHAAEKRILHFVKFENSKDGDGRIRIFEDTNNSKLPDAQDREVEARALELPKGVFFKKAPDYIGINPSGYSTGFLDTASSTFEAALRENRESGDVILATKGQPYIICMDIDPSAGKIRKWHFLTGEEESK